MSEHSSRFDEIIEAEQKKENPFEKSNRTLKRAIKPNSEELSNASLEDEIISESVKISGSEKLNLTKDGKIDIQSLFGESKKAKKMSGHTFYLDDRYYAKLKKIAKEQGISVSNVLNEILKQFL